MKQRDVPNGLRGTKPPSLCCPPGPSLPPQERGIQFIGPTAPVMSVLGDKIAANILAQTANVPSIPWSGDGLEANLTDEGTIPAETFNKGCIHSLEEARECAERIGYPVMLKASEGGGGKGIRMSANEAELTSNYDQVRCPSSVRERGPLKPSKPYIPQGSCCPSSLPNCPPPKADDLALPHPPASRWRYSRTGALPVPVPQQPHGSIVPDVSGLVRASSGAY